MRWLFLVDDPRTYSIIGAAMRVHAALGPGYLENLYHRALKHEFAKYGVPHQSEFPVPVWYDGELLGTFRADFLCHSSILVELKALPHIGSTQISQLSHYLRATNQPIGLLLNFGKDSLEFRRIVAPLRNVHPEIHQS